MNWDGAAGLFSDDPLVRFAAEREAEARAGRPEVVADDRPLWRDIARPEQLEPEGDWWCWLLLAGRGFGKTRAANEWAIEQAREMPGSRGTLISATSSDIRRTLIEGESGILNISRRDFFPEYNPSIQRLTWPNGSTAELVSADKPDRVRGLNLHWAVGDELAAWRYAMTWRLLLLALRLPWEGRRPRIAVPTTPKRTGVLYEVVDIEERDGKRVWVPKQPGTVIARGSTYDNRENLAPGFFDAITTQYEGTTLGRQELNADALGDAEGALWNRSLIERHRVMGAPPMVRIVVAVDPAVSNTSKSDETGIGAAGMGTDGRLYVLADKSGKMGPDARGRTAVGLFDELEADRIVGEVNQGGDLVDTMVARAAEDMYREGERASRLVPYRSVRASRGKQLRAEPVVMLYEQGRVSHVGEHRELEDEMCTWEPRASKWSPNRVDWLVYAITELTGGERMPTKEQMDTASRSVRERGRGLMGGVEW